MASKGNVDIRMVYTDLSDGAQWQIAPIDPMWSVVPSVSQLNGFSEKLISLNLMHICHLGCFRDLVGTAFKLMALNKEYYPGRNINKRLWQLTQDLRVFVKQNGLQLSLRGIKKDTVLWRGNCCPELKAKASDTLVCLRFASYKLQMQAPSKYPGVVACCWAAERFMALLAAGSVFLTPQERETGFELGSLYLSLFVSLAGESLAAGELYFKVRPKLHYIWHLVNDLRLTADCHERSRNPYFDSTFQDEDLIKHLLNAKKRMSFRTSSLNILKRFAVVNKAAYDSLAVP